MTISFRKGKKLFKFKKQVVKETPEQIALGQRMKEAWEREHSDPLPIEVIEHKKERSKFEEIMGRAE